MKNHSDTVKWREIKRRKITPGQKMLNLFHAAQRFSETVYNT